MPKQGIDAKQNRRIRKLEKAINSVEVKESIFSVRNATDGTLLPINTATNPTRLVDIAQGNAGSERVGLKVHLKKVRYAARIQNTAATNEFFRVTIVDWVSDAVPALADIYNTAAPGTGTPDASLYQYSIVNNSSKFFKVLYDKKFWLAGTGNTSGDKRTMMINKVFNQNKNMAFFDSAGSDYTKGLYVIYSSTTGAGNEIYDAVSITFTDL